MILSRTSVAQLKLLIRGDKVAYSSLREDLVGELIDEGLLTIHQNGSRRSLWAIDGEKLRIYLTARYEEFRGLEAIEAESPVRSAMAAATGNSKLVSVRSCPGFPVSTYEPIECRLNGETFEVRPIYGSFVFVTDWTRFDVPEDVVIVGIENMENFRMVCKQRALFEREIPSKRLLFVSRYPQSTDLRRWLQQIPNRYVHFGDFDLAGIHIFLTEFYRYLGNKSAYLIPSDIEIRLQNGSDKRYNDQYRRFKNLCSDDKRLQMLIDMINKYHKCYDQEGYITKSKNAGSCTM